MFNSSALNTLNYASIAIPDYLEYGWVCAPNAAGQSITANTITTLTIDTEIVDTGNYGSVGSNQITLAAGTYTFEAFSASGNSASSVDEAIFALYNVTDAVYVTRKKRVGNGGVAFYGSEHKLEGSFTIVANKVFELRFVVNNTHIIGALQSTPSITLATAGTDQRTTLKLWRFKENFNMGTFYAGGNSSGYTSYGEWAWVCAPNTAGQSISANTITTLTIDAELQDLDGIGSVGSNQITLAVGTYYFELSVPIRDTNNSNHAGIIGLYNISDSSWVSRIGVAAYTYAGVVPTVKGNFRIISPKIFEARILLGVTGGSYFIDNGVATAVIADSTANADQRTTLKVWKK